MRQGEFKAGELIPGTRYRVLGLLGVGGMGTVYEVEHTELGKRFVLKALLSELARRQDLVVRIRNEQRALGRLEHPSIVTVTDAGMTSTEVPYFVMERLDGETLGARIKRSGCLGIDETLGIAVGVLEGLAAAHQIGVIHRDIKPQNIFLAAGSRPKILDFGVAKVADTSGAITARGVAVGTPRYMSPEQASGEQVDGRSDVYAVGLVLFECLVGRGPFDDARDANEMLLAQLSRVPPRLLGRVPGVTPELDALLAALLAKDPDARPRDARSAAEALRELRVRLQQPSEPDTLPRSATVRIGGRAAPLPTTHADGVAARHGGRARLAVTDAAPTLARPARPSGPNDTVIDEQRLGAPAGTATGATGAITIAEHRDPRTRTEILPAFDAGAGDAPTHTRVPLTPTDGSRTLNPVPLPSSAPSPRRMRALPWVVGALALVLGLGLGLGAVLMARPHAESAAAALAAQASPVALTAPSAPPPATAALPPPVETAREPPAEPALAAPEPRASSAPVTSEAPPRPAKSRTPERRAPSYQAQSPAKSALEERIPVGLPKSGL